MPKVGSIEIVSSDMQKYAKSHGISIPSEIYNSKLVYQPAPEDYNALDIPILHSLIVGSAKIINAKLALNYILTKPDKINLIKLYQATFSDSRNLGIEIPLFHESIYKLDEQEINDFIIIRYNLEQVPPPNPLKERPSKNLPVNQPKKEYAPFGEVLPKTGGIIHSPSLPDSHKVDSQTSSIALADKHTSMTAIPSHWSLNLYGSNVSLDRESGGDEYNDDDPTKNYLNDGKDFVMEPSCAANKGSIDIIKDCRWFTPITLPDDLKLLEEPLSDLDGNTIDKLCDAVSRSLVSEQLKNLKKSNVLSSLLVGNLGHFKAHHFDKEDPLYYDTLHTLAYHAGLKQGVKEGRMNSLQNQDPTIAGIYRDIRIERATEGYYLRQRSCSTISTLFRNVSHESRNSRFKEPNI